MKKSIQLLICFVILNFLSARDHKLRTRNYVEVDATFSSVDGIAAVEAAYIGTSTTEKFSADCANAISANIGKADNKFFAWEIQKSKCSKHILQAMVVYAIASIDPDGNIIDPSKRGKLGYAFERLYLPVSKVPYHNAIHAADLLEKYLYFMEYKNNNDIAFRTYLGLKAHEYLAGALAGAGHDAGHPGDNNGYDRIIKTQIATDYLGILENFSCDLTIATLLSEKTEIEKDTYSKYFFNRAAIIGSKKKIVLPQLFKSNKSKVTKFEIETKLKAEHGYKAIKSRPEVQYFNTFFLGSTSLMTFLGILRESIYSTIMNPLDTDFAAVTATEFGGNSANYTLISSTLVNVLLQNKAEKEYKPYPNGSEKSENVVAGMENLVSQDKDIQAKWFIIGHVVHLSDIGNGFNGLTPLIPWFEALMREWAAINCYDSKFTLYSNDQSFFQLSMCGARAIQMNTFFPGFGWQSIATAPIMSNLKADMDAQNKLTLEFKVIVDNYAKLNKDSDCPSIDVDFGKDFDAEDAYLGNKKISHHQIQVRKSKRGISK